MSEQPGKGAESQNPVPKETPSGPKRGFFRRLGRSLVRLTLFFLLLAFVGYLLLFHTSLPLKAVDSYVDSNPGPVRIGNITGSLSTGFTVDELEIEGDRQTSIHLKDVTLECNGILDAYFKRRVIVGQFSVGSGELHLPRDFDTGVTPFWWELLDEHFVDRIDVVELKAIDLSELVVHHPMLQSPVRLDAFRYRDFLNTASGKNELGYGSIVAEHFEIDVSPENELADGQFSRSVKGIVRSSGHESLLRDIDFNAELILNPESYLEFSFRGDFLDNSLVIRNEGPETSFRCRDLSPGDYVASDRMLPSHFNCDVVFSEQSDRGELATRDSTFQLGATTFTIESVEPSDEMAVAIVGHGRSQDVDYECRIHLPALSVELTPTPEENPEVAYARVYYGMPEEDLTEDQLALARATLDRPEFPEQARGFLPGTIARQAHQMSCRNKVKQLGLALHNYHDVHGAFPPGYQADVSGKPPHSWRVDILPYVEQKALYEQYNFDEPWDSPNNLKVADQMPELFRCPSAPRDEASANLSHYVVVFSELNPDGSPQTAFPIGDRTSYGDVKKGTYQTLLVVEVKDPVPWTKPDADLHFGDMIFNGGTQTLGSHHAGGSFALNVDGSVRMLPHTTSPEELRSLLLLTE